MFKKNVYTLIGVAFLVSSVTLSGFTDSSPQRLETELPEDTRFLWDEYANFKISPTNPAVLKHEGLMKILGKLHADHPDIIKIEKLGESVERRSINLVTLGTGPKKLLLWSQMHGDEPTATAALLDIMEYITENQSHPFVKEILSHTTLLIIVMLNPDGAEKFNRRNAMDIDINRDARFQQTPEGRILKKAQERFNPDFGFNLHDHGPRKMVGNTKKFVAISLLVPPFDLQNTQNETTLKAKKVAATLYQSIAPWCYGYISRYDGDYMPRAFGDSMQEWGVSTILLESGGWTGNDLSVLTQINFVGLLSVFHAIANDSYLSRNPTLYDQLLRSGEYSIFDLMISKVTIVNGKGHPPFMGHIGINYRISRRSPDWKITRGYIADLGDLQVTTGKQVIDGQGLVCVPGFIALNPNIRPGKMPAESDMKEMLKQGIMTQIGHLNLNDESEVAQLESFSTATIFLLNTGFLGYIGDFPDQLSLEDRDRFCYGLTRRILGVYPSPVHEELSKYLSWFKTKSFSINQFKQTNIPHTIPIQDVPEFTGLAAKQFGLSGRGVIRRDCMADLLLFEKDEAFMRDGTLRLDKLKFIIQNGSIVFEDGEFVAQPSGVLVN